MPVTPSFRRASRFLLPLLVILLVHGQHVWALRKKSIGELTAHEIEEEVEQCAFVQELNIHKKATTPLVSGTMSRIFQVLFPGSPAVNALLATAYISGPPNFLLALCPPNINPNSLSTMVAFAVGGILGDTLFHLLPEIFLGEVAPDEVKFVMVEPNRNLLLGAAILVGFMTFVLMDKSLRIATGGGDSHDHSHSHTDATKAVKVTGSEKKDTSNARARRAQANPNGTAAEHTNEKDFKDLNPSVKLSGYLNLIADFTHNITDGLALSSSFYASPTIGATTTVAVFLHEIPHEVGDFALLIQSGFSKRRAMGAQFVTAVGAFLGTLLGIAIQELSSTDGTASEAAPGLAGTSLTWGDLLLPFTAGTFLYVGTVAVVPEMLETGPNKKEEIRNTVTQFAAIAAGAGIMLGISWS